MRNQHLSLELRNLATEELGIALQILATQSDRDARHLEIFALAKTIVARGLTLKMAQALEVRSNRPEKVARLTLLLPPGDLSQPEWLIPAVPIPLSEERGDCPGCRQTVESFPAPDYWRVGALLRRLIKIKYPGWEGEPVQPFAAPIKTKREPAKYAHRLKSIIEHADLDRGPHLARRVTFSRLGRVLPQAIYDQTGNLIPVTYATLRKELTGEDGRFYATPSVPHAPMKSHAVHLPARSSAEPGTCLA